MILAVGVIGVVLLGGAGERDDTTRAGSGSANDPVTTSKRPPVELGDLEFTEGLVVFDDRFDDPRSGWLPQVSEAIAGQGTSYGPSGLVFTSVGPGERFETPFHTLPDGITVSTVLAPELPTDPEVGVLISCEYRSGSDQARTHTISMIMSMNGRLEMASGASPETMETINDGQMRSLVQPRTGPLHLSLRCTMKDGTITATPIIGLTQEADVRVVPGFAGRFTSNIGLAGSGRPATLVFQRVTIRDPSREAVPEPARLDPSGGALIGAWSRDDPLDGTLPPIDDGAGFDESGFVLRPRTDDVSTRLPVSDVDGGISVATRLEISPSAPARSEAGVACLAVGRKWYYTLKIRRDGRWALRRLDDSTGTSLQMTVRLGGSPELPPGPVDLTIVCLPKGGSADQPSLVRVVGFVGDDQVIDVWDPAPWALPSWSAGVSTSEPDEGPFDVTYHEAQVSAVDR